MDGLVAVSDRLCRRVGAAPSRQRLAKTGRRAGRGSLWFPCSGQDSGSRLEGISMSSGVSMGSGEARGETGKLLKLNLGYEPTRPCSDGRGAGRVRAQVLPDVAPTARTQRETEWNEPGSAVSSASASMLAIPAIHTGPRPGPGGLPGTGGRGHGSFLCDGCVAQG